MKKIVALLVAIVCMLSCFGALAADVSGYEAHATINLDPFKTEKYGGSFSDMSFSGKLYMSSEIVMKMKWDPTSTYSYNFTVYPQVEFETLLGVMVFSPSLYFRTSDYSSVGGFYCVIGENRYLLSATMDYSGSYSSNGHITIGKNMYAILKEIAETSHTVRFCVGGSTGNIYTLTADDIAIISQFVSDMESSGLANQLVDDTVVVITQYN